MTHLPPRRQLNPEALSHARQQAGDGSIKAAAEAAGLTWQGYARWEAHPARRRFDWNAFTALLAYLGVPAERITEEVPNVTSRG